MNSTDTNTSSTPDKVSEDVNMDTSLSSVQSEGSTPSQVPEDQRGLRCPCCNAELTVSMKMTSDSQHAFVMSVSKKEKRTQPSFSYPGSTRSQPLRAQEHQGASVVDKNKMKTDEYSDPSRREEKMQEGKHPASFHPAQRTGKETNKRKSQEPVQPSRSGSLRLSTVKVGCFVNGETFGAVSVIMETIKDNKWPSPRVEETDLDYCDVIIVFCPVISRAGSDVDVAMKHPKVALANKPVILVLMHHTRDPDYSTEGIRWSEVYNIDLALHVFFHETQRGLLKCKHNEKTIAALQKQVYRYKD